MVISGEGMPSPDTFRVLAADPAALHLFSQAFMRGLTTVVLAAAPAAAASPGGGGMASGIDEREGSWREQFGLLWGLTLSMWAPTHNLTRLATMK